MVTNYERKGNKDVIMVEEGKVIRVESRTLYGEPCVETSAVFEPEDHGTAEAAFDILAQNLQ